MLKFNFESDNPRSNIMAPCRYGLLSHTSIERGLFAFNRTADDA